MHITDKENLTSVLFWYHGYWEVVFNFKHSYICQLPTIFQAFPSFYEIYVLYGWYKILILISLPAFRPISYWDHLASVRPSSRPSIVPEVQRNLSSRIFSNSVYIIYMSISPDHFFFRWWSRFGLIHGALKCNSETECNSETVRRITKRTSFSDSDAFP